MSAQSIQHFQAQNGSLISHDELILTNSSYIKLRDEGETYILSEGNVPLNVTITEIFLILSALTVWVGAMWMFFKKYSKACLIESREFRFEHKPKNLENIKVVSDSDDGFIHKAYNAGHRNTMEARRLHLEILNSTESADPGIHKLANQTFNKYSLLPLEELKENICLETLMEMENDMSNVIDDYDTSDIDDDISDDISHMSREEEEASNDNSTEKGPLFTENLKHTVVEIKNNKFVERLSIDSE